MIDGNLKVLFCITKKACEEFSQAIFVPRFRGMGLVVYRDEIDYVIRVRSIGPVGFNISKCRFAIL